MELAANTWIGAAAENPKRRAEVIAALLLDGTLMHNIDREGAMAAGDVDCQEIYKSFCMAAASASGMSLRYCSHKMRDDEDVVVAAVQQDGNARSFASGGMRAVTKRWLAPHNREKLPDGVCRTKSWTFMRTELEIIDADHPDHPGEHRAAASAPGEISAINKLELATGKDIDGDGDIGKAGSKNMKDEKKAKKMAKQEKKRQKMIAKAEKKAGKDLDGDGDVGAIGRDGVVNSGDASTPHNMISRDIAHSLLVCFSSGGCVRQGEGHGRAQGEVRV